MGKLRTKVTDQGVLIDSDVPLHLPLGSEVRDLAKSPEEATVYFALDELWQDGHIDSAGEGSWIVPFDSLLYLEESTAKVLRLPQPDRTIRSEIKSVGIATDRNFHIELEFFHPDMGRLDSSRQFGPAFILTGGSCVLLPVPSWKLATAVASRPAEDAPTEDRFEYLSRCVALAEEASAQIDGYLSDNALEVISDVGLEIEEAGEEIHLGAAANELTNKDLVLPNGKARPFPIMRGADGKRRRLVSSVKARASIEEIAAKSKLSGTQVPEFLTNPEAFVPEGVDLSDFSGRVRGFHTKVYNSRPYLHVSKEPRGWLEIDLGVTTEGTLDGEDGESISVDDYRELVDQAKENGERFVKHRGQWIEIDESSANQFIQTIDKVERLKEKEPRISAQLLLDVIPNVELLEFEVDIPDEITPERPWFQELPDINPPPEFSAVLDSHQLLGFRWLVYLHELGAGGLLADEMGVGKTAQVIALLTKLHVEDQLSPALVVLPKTLVSNWMEELAKFAPSIDRLHVHTGPQRSKSSEFLESMNIVLTTYDTARQDQMLLGTIDWTVVIADEAQFIKNPTAARTSVVKALKADQALALTGTPVENGLIEFWCIMDYVQPGLLKSWSDFRKDHERPLVSASDDLERERLANDLLTRLDPHYLRRLKREVLADLPEKRIAEPIKVSLSPLQRARYQSIVEGAKDGGRGAVLGAITKLLMTCSHPRASEGDWEVADGDALIAESPKLAATLEVLEKVHRSQEKVLVFTTWKSTQKILQRAIWARFGVMAEIVNGDLTSRRQAVIDQFRNHSGFGVLILAPEVAGFGLNLVEANHVIHYTRPWNPAKENQATDRVHRRGQQKPVTVYYPIVAGTVEDRLAELLAEKSKLTHDVLRPSNERMVSADELMNNIELSEIA